MISRACVVASYKYCALLDQWLTLHWRTVRLRRCHWNERSAVRLLLPSLIHTDTIELASRNSRQSYTHVCERVYANTEAWPHDIKCMQWIAETTVDCRHVIAVRMEPLCGWNGIQHASRFNANAWYLTILCGFISNSGKSPTSSENFIRFVLFMCRPETEETVLMLHWQRKRKSRAVDFRSSRQRTQAQHARTPSQSQRCTTRSVAHSHSHGERWRQCRYIATAHTTYVLLHHHTESHRQIEWKSKQKHEAHNVRASLRRTLTAYKLFSLLLQCVCVCVRECLRVYPIWRLMLGKSFRRWLRLRYAILHFTDTIALICVSTTRRTHAHTQTHTHAAVPNGEDGLCRAVRVRGRSAGRRGKFHSERVGAEKDELHVWDRRYCAIRDVRDDKFIL